MTKLRMLRPRVALSHAKPLGQTIATKRLRGKAWMQIRQRVLQEEPICRDCLKADTLPINASTEVDHIVPLFEGGTDQRHNLQGLCDTHHDQKSAIENARRCGAYTAPGGA